MSTDSNISNSSPDVQDMSSRAESENSARVSKMGTKQTQLPDSKLSTPRVVGNESRVSNISKATIQSNNNARITSGKTAEGSGPSSTADLSNLSLQSSRTKDSIPSRSGKPESSTKDVNIAETQHTSSRARESSAASRDPDKQKDAFERDITVTPDEIPAKDSDITPDQPNNYHPRDNAEPEGNSSPAKSEANKRKETKPTSSRKIPRPIKSRKKEAKGQPDDNLGKLERNKEINSTRENSGASFSGKSDKTANKHRKVSQEKSEPSRRRKATPNKVPTPKPKDIGLAKKKPSAGEQPKPSLKKTGSQENSIPKVQHADNAKVKLRPGNMPDAAQKKRYYELLDLHHENEAIIDDNQRRIDRQEKEMDKVYAATRNELENLAGSMGELIEARRIHSNFQNEATRIRVQHKTNLVSADVFETENNFLQEEITELQRQINQAKLINRFIPEELRENIQERWEYYENQKQRNDRLKQQIETLKEDLNNYKCGAGDDSPTHVKFINEPTTEDRQTDEKWMPNAGSSNKPLSGTKADVRAGYSKSLDAVTTTESHDGPRETKSDHRGQSRIRKVINSVKALLPGRRRKDQDVKKEDIKRGVILASEATHAHVPVKPLLHRRFNDGPERLPPIQQASHNPVVGVLNRAKQRLFQTDDSLKRSGLLPTIHSPRPPTCPRPESGKRSFTRRFRKIDFTDAR